MRSRAKLAAPVVAALLVAAAAGCGGSGGGSKSSSGGVAGGGAAALPASTPAFIAFSSDFGSDQWKQVEALGAKFPSYDKLLAQGRQQLTKQGLDFEKDVVPALGPEVDLAFLDFQNSGNDFVALTKPGDRSKLDAVVQKSKSPPATADLGGGYVGLAQKKTLLDSLSGVKDKLGDDPSFKDAMGALPGGDLVRLYLNGPAVQDALTKAIKSSSTGQSVPFQLPTNAEKLDWIAAAGTAQPGGARLDGVVKVEPAPTIAPFTAELPKALASGAILYAGFANLDQPLKTFLDSLSKSSPTLSKQLGQLEGVSGLSLDNDVVPLLKNEGGVAIYPSAGKTPTVVFALKVDDPAKVEKLLGQVGALVALAGGGGGGPTAVSIPGYPDAKQLKLGTTSIDYGVANGTLVVSNAQAGLGDVNGSGAKLADDPTFKAAQAGAKMPDKTTGFLYADLKTGASLILGALKSSSSSSVNVQPGDLQALQSALFYGTIDGDLLRIAGFVGIS